VASSSSSSPSGTLSGVGAVDYLNSVENIQNAEKKIIM